LKRCQEASKAIQRNRWNTGGCPLKNRGDGEHVEGTVSVTPTLLREIGKNFAEEILVVFGGKTAACSLFS